MVLTRPLVAAIGGSGRRRSFLGGRKLCLRLGNVLIQTLNGTLYLGLDLLELRIVGVGGERSCNDLELQGKVSRLVWGLEGLGTGLGSDYSPENNR